MKELKERIINALRKRAEEETGCGVPQFVTGLYVAIKIVKQEFEKAEEKANDVKEEMISDCN